MRKIKIIEKQVLNDITVKFTMGSGGDAFTAPGQFAKLYKAGTDEGVLVPVAEYDSDRFIVILRVNDEVGKAIAMYEAGDEIEAELGIGNGFDVHSIPNGCVLAGEGTGIPSLLGLMRQLLIYGKDCRIVLGYDSKDSVFMLKPFKMLATNLEVITADGSNGRKGHISNAIHNEKYVCACGSDDVLMKIANKTEDGQFSSVSNTDGNMRIVSKDKFLEAC